MTGGPDLAAVARFRTDLHRLGHAAGPVLVAVSGGADSLALLLLTRALAGDDCRAATVDHGLRPAARREAEWVARVCAELGIPHVILSAPLPDRAQGSANLSSRARALRHALLRAEAARSGDAAILMAHHADDQAETLMMRLNRGAGVGGLAGVRAVNGRILRPLLGWRRAELAAIVVAAGLVAVDDPTNRDERFDRARMRRQLSGADWLAVPEVASSARLLGEADAALDWTVDWLAADRLRREAASVVLDAGDLPDELARRLVLRAVSMVDADAAPRGGQVAQLVGALRRGGTATLGAVLCRSAGARWTFCLAPPRRSP